MLIDFNIRTILIATLALISLIPDLSHAYTLTVCDLGAPEGGGPQVRLQWRSPFSYEDNKIIVAWNPFDIRQEPWGRLHYEDQTIDLTCQYDAGEH